MQTDCCCCCCYCRLPTIVCRLECKQCAPQPITCFRSLSISMVDRSPQLCSGSRCESLQCSSVLPRHCHHHQQDMLGAKAQSRHVPLAHRHSLRQSFYYSLECTLLRLYRLFESSFSIRGKAISLRWLPAAISADILMLLLSLSLSFFL